MAPPHTTLAALQKLAAAVASVQLPDDLAGSDIERRKQRRRAVAHVVVGSPRGKSWCERQDRLSAIERLNLALLIDAEHHRLNRGIQIQADNVADLVDEQRIGRELEAFLPVRLQTEGAPDATDRGLRQPHLARHAARTPIGGVFRYRFERLGNHSVDTSIVDRTRCARARRIEQAIKPVRGKAVTPFRDRLLGHRQVVRDDLAVDTGNILENDPRAQRK